MNNSLTFEVQKKVALDTIQILTMAAGLVSACSIAGAKTAVALFQWIPRDSFPICA